jgi:prepilin-type processing-associated H-X9-DG protein
MALNFQASESQASSRSSHPGGANFLFADGSVRFLQATDARLLLDSAGKIVEIHAVMVDTRTGVSWVFQILPFIEQSDLYSFYVTSNGIRYQFDALGHVLARTPMDHLELDPCLPDAVDVFRPEPTERFGHLDGDAASADGVWGLRFSPGRHRMYFADHAPVLADFRSDGLLKLAFPMTEVPSGTDQARQVSIVQAIVEVRLNDLPNADQLAASPVCMSLARDGNVFAVWLTVGYFEVVDDTTATPRLRFFAIVDRSQIVPLGTGSEAAGALSTSPVQ